MEVLWGWSDDPFAFIVHFGSGILARFVNRAKEPSLFEGFWVGKDKISVFRLQFADDIMSSLASI